MQQIQPRTTKVFVDNKSGNNVLYLPLDKLVDAEPSARWQTAAAAAAASGAAAAGASQPANSPGAVAAQANAASAAAASAACGSASATAATPASRAAASSDALRSRESFRSRMREDDVAMRSAEHEQDHCARHRGCRSCCSPLRRWWSSSTSAMPRVVRRTATAPALLGPGLHVKLPPPLQTVTLVDSRIAVARRAGRRPLRNRRTRTICSSNPVVKYRVTDPLKLLAETKGDVQSLQERLALVARGALGDAFGEVHAGRCARQTAGTRRRSARRDGRRPRHRSVCRWWTCS